MTANPLSNSVSAPAPANQPKATLPTDGSMVDTTPKPSLSAAAQAASSASRTSDSGMCGLPFFRRRRPSVATAPTPRPALSGLSRFFRSRAGPSLPLTGTEAGLTPVADPMLEKTPHLESQPQISEWSKKEGSASQTLVGKPSLTEKTTAEASVDLTNAASSTTAVEPDAMMKEMQRQVKQANARSPPLNTKGMFEKACSVDILFLLDTTRSMKPYIDAAKNQVNSIVREVKEAFLDETEVRVAVVSYTDHNRGTENIKFLDFVSSPDKVAAFLNDLHVHHGKDYPEDVLGGMDKAINASWKLQTRCLIHITDAPPHGTPFHDWGPKHDDYNIHGTEPHGLTYTPVIKRLLDLKVNYALLRITQHTDRMLLKFSELYAAKGAEIRLHKDNKFVTRANGQNKGLTLGVPWTESTDKRTAGLQFEELPLGTSYSALQGLVVNTVTRSASLTATRIAGSAGQRFNSLTGRTQTITSPGNLASVQEDNDSSTDNGQSTLEKVAPRWGVRRWFSETLALKGFCPNIGVHNAGTLDYMMASDTNVNLSVSQLTVHKRPSPFATGAMRMAFYARTAASNDRFVVKSYRERDPDAMARMIEDMQAQALCKAFALEFNCYLKEEYTIDFITTMGLQNKAASTTANRYLSIEPFIEGKYVKYNSNAGYVKDRSQQDPFNDAAQAFSHFTFERSRGTFLVSDLQGVGHVLTDPAIQTRDRNKFKLSRTNIGMEGFKFFFATHECNSICEKLKLQSNKRMFITKEWAFRDVWPVIGSTVCCSNKLCRKIVRLSQAHISEVYPDCHWCSTCWPQLESTMIHWLCLHPMTGEPTHAYDVSLFFHESQGQMVPSQCPEHRAERANTVLSLYPATASITSLWQRIQAANHGNTVPR